MSLSRLVAGFARRERNRRISYKSMFHKAHTASAAYRRRVRAEIEAACAKDKQHATAEVEAMKAQLQTAAAEVANAKAVAKQECLTETQRLKESIEGLKSELAECKAAHTKDMEYQLYRQRQSYDAEHGRALEAATAEAASLKQALGAAQTAIETVGRTRVGTTLNLTIPPL